MNTRNPPPDYNRISDAAKLRAAQLRQEAISEFFNFSGAAARQALRSAQRLANSLARHARLREHGGA
jgi:hypothetical protein